MFFLSKNGYFKVKKEEVSEDLSNIFYRTEYTADADYYYIKANDLTLEKLEKNFDKHIIDHSCYLYRLKEKLKNSNLSINTQKTYFSINLNFIKTVNKTPDSITENDITRYLSILKRRKKSSNTLTVNYSALRFFYEIVLNKISFQSIKRPVATTSPSGTLSRLEMYKLLNSIKNPKHKLLLEITYGCGLKLNEVIKLRLTDINLQDSSIKVRGHSPRTIKISPILKKKIKEFLNHTNNTKFLFFSVKKNGKHISERTAEKIFKNALKKANINRKLSFKSLRDSFTVHMLEKNVKKEELAKVLGINITQFNSKYHIFLENEVHLPDLLSFEDI